MEALSSLWEGLKSHPWIWGGILAAVLAYVYFVSGSKSSAGQNFSFSVGPSDAQVAAGTQLQIAQAADQTAVSMQSANLTAQQSIAGDYFNYLNTSQATQAGIVQSNNATALSVANDQLQQGLANTNVIDAANARNFYLASNAQSIVATIASSTPSGAAGGALVGQTLQGLV